MYSEKQCIFLWLIITLFFMVSLTGCEQPVQGGDPIAIASISQSHYSSQIRQNNYLTVAGDHQPLKTSNSFSPYIGKPFSNTVTPLSNDWYEAQILEFQQSYNKNKQPKIAVYFNRALSEEIREWIIDRLDVLTGTGQIISVGTNQQSDNTLTSGGEIRLEGSDDGQKGVTAYTQKRIESLERAMPREEYMWRFENSFLQPFLKAHVKIVDRATILRIEASKKDQTDPYSSLSVKQNEMEALQKHADIFVEILINRDQSSPSGYSFRATAKEVSTGILVGSAILSGSDSRYEESLETVATDSGYQIRKYTPSFILENISTELALDLMNSITNYWSQDD